MHVINKYLFLSVVLVLFCLLELFEDFFTPDSFQTPCTPSNRTKIITFEEDGRLGNLLMETATLVIVAEKLNISAKILPQMSSKMSNLWSILPVRLQHHLSALQL